MGRPSGRFRRTELPHLGTFVKCAELGSFTAAAAALGMTQAAVSQRIARLESDLSQSLFERRAGRIRLSPPGWCLYEHARQILDLHGKARAALGESGFPVAGDLALAASSVPGECLLPALLEGFRRMYPHMHVRATVGDSATALHELERGEASVALIGSRAERNHLEFRPLGTDSLVLVVPPGHRWAGRRIVPEALRGEPLVLREPGSGSRCAVLKSLERLGVFSDELNVVLELGSNAAIKDAVARGLGAAFLSRLAVEKDLDSGALIAVEGFTLGRDFYLAYDRRRPLPAPARVFLHYLEAHPSLPAR